MFSAQCSVVLFLPALPPPDRAGRGGVHIVLQQRRHRRRAVRAAACGATLAAVPVAAVSAAAPNPVTAFVTKLSAGAGFRTTPALFIHERVLHFHLFLHLPHVCLLHEPLLLLHQFCCRSFVGLVALLVFWVCHPHFHRRCHPLRFFQFPNRPSLIPVRRTRLCRPRVTGAQTLSQVV